MLTYCSKGLSLEKKSDGENNIVGMYRLGSNRTIHYPITLPSKQMPRNG